MLRAGSGGNVCVCVCVVVGGGGGGGANLPVCHIFTRGIHVYSSFSPRSWWGRIRATVPHAVEQSIPCFLHEHLWEQQSDLQLHITISNKDARAAGGSVLTGRVFHLLVYNPNLVVGAQHLSTAVPDGKPWEAVVDSGCRSRRETFELYKWSPCCDLQAESRIS